MTSNDSSPGEGRDSEQEEYLYPEEECIPRCPVCGFQDRAHFGQCEHLIGFYICDGYVEGDRLLEFEGYVREIERMLDNDVDESLKPKFKELHLSRLYSKIGWGGYDCLATFRGVRLAVLGMNLGGPSVFELEQGTFEKKVLSRLRGLIASLKVAEGPGGAS